MSSCLILQAKDKLYIGADTSSSVFIDDKLYRLNNNTKKLFLLNDNTVLYCAGNNSIAEKVVQHISSIYCRNDFSLISLKNWLIEMYPYENKDKTVYDVEILIATFKNNRTIVYQMSQYKNYDIVSFEVSDAGVQILSAGIKNAECMSFAENELLNKSGVKSIFRTTFNNLSCNYIGGCLDLYEITRNGAVKIFDNEKINEHGIQYVHDVFNGLSVSLNAEVLVSKLVMSENLWLENNSGNYKFDDNGFTATSGKNTIKIQPNNSGELFSIYNGSNKQVYINSSGDVEFAGSLKSASGQFAGLVSGGSIDIGNGVFTVDKNGNMYASSCNITGNISSSNITSSSATFGGITLDSNGLSSEQFSIDSHGNASFSGTLSATSITSSGALNDYLTSSDLGANGTTVIDGGRINTDTLVAKSGAFNKSFAVGVGGSVSGTNLTTTGAYMRATEDSILMGLGLSDVSLRISNREKHFYGNCDYAKEAGEASSAEYADSATDSENAVTLKSKNGKYSAYIRNDNKFSPERDNSMQLGSTTYRWKDVWAGNGTIQTSDRNAKKNIEPISDKLLELFELLMPVSFQFIDGTSGRTHIGFISQDVEWAMEQVGLTDLEFAGFCKDVKTEYYTDNDGQEQIRNVLDENGNPIWIYSLRYSEFIALNTAMIQRNSKKIDGLTSLLREKGVI